HVDVGYAQGAEVVDGGVDLGGGDGDVAGLAQALGAQRIAGRRDVHLLDGEGGDVLGARHRVVHQRAGQQLAVAVVDDGLHERLAQALGQAAVQLPLGQ